MHWRNFRLRMRERFTHVHVMHFRKLRFRFGNAGVDRFRCRVAQVPVDVHIQADNQHGAKADQP